MLYTLLGLLMKYMSVYILTHNIYYLREYKLFAKFSFRETYFTKLLNIILPHFPMQVILIKYLLFIFKQQFQFLI